MPPSEVIEKRICIDHSGHEARIEACEKNDVDLFGRMREVELAVWKSAGITGTITAVVVVILQRVVH